MLNKIAQGTRNIIVVDRPGIGKTTALNIAAVDMCISSSGLCCIICATFDSSYQLYMRIKRLCKECEIVAKIGFINELSEEHSDQDNLHFNLLIGTCRESIDFIKKKNLSDSIKRIFLDDADVYLAYTYVGPWLDQLEAAQKVCVSASINERLMAKIKIHFKDDKSSFIAPDTRNFARLNYMDHAFITMKSYTRLTMLKEICKKAANKKLIIFCKVCMEKKL